MGKKGAKLTADAEVVAEALVEALASVGEVSSRKMFGGLGIFESGTMFGIVNSAGQIYLRTGDENIDLFTNAGSHKHGKMPYHSVPDAVLKDESALILYAESSIAVSRRAKK
jgi:DNA transformation protein